MLPELSIMPLENINSTGVTHDDRHMTIIMFIIQVIAYFFIASVTKKKSFIALTPNAYTLKLFTAVINAAVL